MRRDKVGMKVAIVWFKTLKFVREHLLFRLFHAELHRGDTTINLLPKLIAIYFVPSEEIFLSYLFLSQISLGFIMRQNAIVCSTTQQDTCTRLLFLHKTCNKKQAAMQPVNFAYWWGKILLYSVKIKLIPSVSNRFASNNSIAQKIQPINASGWHLSNERVDQVLGNE